MGNDHSEVVDVENPIHIRILQVERTLHLVDPIGQLEEFGESQLGNIVQALRSVPLEAVPISFARVALLARTDTVIGRVKKSSNLWINTRPGDRDDMIGTQPIGGPTVSAHSPFLQLLLVVPR